MKLNKVVISNYKSIKKSAEIRFSPQLITFIGKNGSGKTNVLDALFAIFDKRAARERESIQYKFLVNISEKNFDDYKDVVDIKDKNITVEAYRTNENNSPSININRIKSTKMVNLLEKTEESIDSLSKRFKSELEKFHKLIGDLTHDKWRGPGFSIDIDFTEEDIKKSTNYRWYFYNLYSEVDRLIVDLKEMVNERKKGDEIVLEYHYLKSGIQNLMDRDFEIKYIEPKLTKFERKHIHVDENAIKQEIKKINKQYKEYINKIDNLYRELQTKVDSLNAIINQHEKEQNHLDNEYASIWNKIISICNPKVYYLRNENNQLFFQDQQNRDPYYYSIDEEVIIETFINYKYPDILQNELKSDFNLKNISKQDLKKISEELEKFINDNLPAYEKDMISHIKVGNELSLYIVEKSGDEIPFSSTNAGRRWFYTYFFVKGCLQPGDILLMDEPANNLHPEAQTHIRKELEELEDNTIILATHSPYMISPVASVYYTEMTENGTVVTNRDNEALQSMLLGLGVLEKETVIGDILLKNELLSFKEIGRNLRRAIKDKKNLTQKKVAEDYNIDDRFLRRKLAGENLTYSDVKWICEKYDFSPYDILLKNKIG
ncbi:MAG: AAA family ATPase [archaeon]